MNTITMYNGGQASFADLPASVRYFCFFNNVELNEVSLINIEKRVPENPEARNSQVEYHLNWFDRQGRSAGKGLVRRNQWELAPLSHREQFGYDQDSNPDFLPILDNCPPPPPHIEIIEVEKEATTSRRESRPPRGRASPIWPPLPTTAPPELPPLPNSRLPWRTRIIGSRKINRKGEEIALPPYIVPLVKID